MYAIDNNFSWMQIHVEGKDYALYLYNQKGLIKRIFKSPDLEVVQTLMEKTQKSNERIRKALVEAVQKLTTDPDALKRLQERHKQTKGT